MDGSIVLISFLVVRKTSSQMSCNKTDLGIGIVHANGDGSLVACHPGHPSLFDTAFDVLDMF